MSLYPPERENDADKRCDLFDVPRGGSGRFVYRYGRVIPKHQLNYQDDDKRSELAAPMVMRDIPEYRSMVDGSFITSRSWHREHLRRHGKIEVGNEQLPEKEYKPDRSDIGQDIKDTIEQLGSGYVNPDEGVHPDGAAPEATDDLDGFDVDPDTLTDGQLIRQSQNEAGVLAPAIDVDPKSYKEG